MAYVRTRLGRLFYEEHGAARRSGDPAIVLLHGLLFDGGMWRGQVEPLAALGRVIVLDGPGHGKSEPAPRFMLEDHSDALLDAFGDLGIDRAIVVGLSWGGMVAMRFAVQHAARVAGLVLMDTSAESEPMTERLKYRAMIAMHRRIGLPRALYFREAAPLLFAPKTLAERPELAEAAYSRAMGFERGGVARAAIAVLVHRKNVLAALSRVRAPTLVLCGSEDRAQPPERNRRIAAAIPGATFGILEGLGHMSTIEGPAQVNDRLVPFVNSLLLPS